MLIKILAPFSSNFKPPVKPATLKIFSKPLKGPSVIRPATKAAKPPSNSAIPPPNRPRPEPSLGPSGLEIGTIPFKIFGKRSLKNAQPRGENPSKITFC